MKAINYLLLLIFASLAIGCGDTPEQTQQGLEIDALNQVLSESSNFEQALASLPTNCAGTVLENFPGLLIKCLFETVPFTYLIIDGDLVAQLPPEEQPRTAQAPKATEIEFGGFLDISVLDFEGLSCDLEEQSPVENDVNLMIFNDGGNLIVADLSTGTTPRFVAINSGNVNELGIPCPPSLFEEQF
ncbi:MAG: hypothetical protein HN509_11705 [Halobacteriovoraceae bacterium]|jgi:hypothetical protein|nr:hypothetical protein [Halobacteriovoraceae bacterium]MBT5094506.1 hypothetical protein [Halobacteriovoraceae bacterium]